MEFKKYRRTNIAEMVQFMDFVGDMGFISVSEEDKKLSNEEFAKGYVARNPNNHEDIWYVAKKYFDENFEELEKVNISSQWQLAENPVGTLSTSAPFSFSSEEEMLIEAERLFKSENQHNNNES